MRLLLDSCISNLVEVQLRVAGHDVAWVGDWPLDPGDEEILAKAHQEKRVLVTLDKDFGELAIVRGLPHSGIVRLVNLSLLHQPAACLQVLSGHSEDLLKGAIITAEPGRMRIRPPAT